MRNYIALLTVLIILGSCSQKKEKISQLSDLKGKRICVLTGSAGDQVARDRFPDSGFLDMALSAFNVTEERKAHVNYSDPYLMQDISALVRK